MQRYPRLLAVFLLGIYALVGTAVLPASVALLAALDGSHSVRVEMTSNGTHLVLNHEGLKYTPTVADHSTAASRALVSLCHNDAAGNHELTAASLNELTLTERKSLSAFLAALAKPVFNAAATFAHLQSLPHYLWRPEPDKDRSRSTKGPSPLAPRPMMATVQLLL